MAEPVATPDTPAAETHWLDSTPDYAPLAKDADARKALSEYKTPSDAHKALIEAKRHIRTTFRVPETLEGLEQGEVEKVTKRLKGILKPEHIRALSGAPTKAEEYVLDKPRMPQGCTADEAVEKNVREFGVKHGLSQEAVAELHGMIHTRDGERFTAEVEDLVTAGKEATAALEKAYGKEEWAQRRERADNMLLEYGAKVGKTHAQILADIIGVGKSEKVAALLATIAEIAVATGSGLTKLPGATPGKPGKINVASRWGASKEYMES